MSSFKRMLVIVVVSVLCACASQALAGTVFYDNFDSEGGQSNSGPVIGEGDIGGSWVSIEGTQISNVKVEGADDGLSYVQMRPLATDPAQAWAVLSSGAAAGTQNETVTLTQTIYKEGNQASHGIALVDGQPDETFAGQLFNIEIASDGSITYDDNGSTYALDNVTCGIGAWQDITLTADLAAKTFTLAVAGHGSDTGSWTTGNKIQSIVNYGDLIGTGVSNYCYMDNVQIESTGPVPEPGAIILLLTGLIGLSVYAWRKHK